MKKPSASEWNNGSGCRTANSDSGAQSFAAGKARLRSEALALRAAFPLEQARLLSGRVESRLRTWIEERHIRRVGGYFALPGEVDIDGFLAWCQERAMEVAVPVFDAQERRYRFSFLRAGSRIVRGHYGIREPEPLDWVDAGCLDLVVVPGVAFDLTGGRLGRGAGYYDRMLGECAASGKVSGDEGGTGRKSGPCRVGIAFEFQIVPSVPMTQRDVRMEWMVTEDRMIACG